MELIRFCLVGWTSGAGLEAGQSATGRQELERLTKEGAKNS